LFIFPSYHQVYRWVNLKCSIFLREERTPSTYQWSKRIVYVLIGEQGQVKSTAASLIHHSTTAPLAC